MNSGVGTEGTEGRKNSTPAAPIGSPRAWGLPYKIRGGGVNVEDAKRVRNRVGSVTGAWHEKF
jgi:hypothetical protein